MYELIINNSYRQMKELCIIAACDINRIIGINGKLPWNIPEDFQYFSDKTAGQICITGRIGYHDNKIYKKDDRKPIVLSRTHLTNIHTVLSLTEALSLAEKMDGALYICGGQKIYEEAIILAETRPTRLFITIIDEEYEGDRYFPEWRHLPWREVWKKKSSDGNVNFTFYELVLN
jgi:dihydrofolate reductase